MFFLDGEYFTYTRHEPIGVCGQIIPVSRKNNSVETPRETGYTALRVHCLSHSVVSETTEIVMSKNVVNISLKYVMKYSMTE